MKNSELFSGKAQDYSVSRPGYPEAAVQFLLECSGLKKPVVADIGAGTGIFSKELLKAGAEVFAVEPNADMGAAALRDLSVYSRFHLIEATAEKTGLADGFCDVITAATSFHWFDIEKFRAECVRILKPDGLIALVYNEQKKCDLKADRHEIMKKYCGRKECFNQGASQVYFAKIKQFFYQGYEVKRFENNLCWDEETFLKRCLSISFSLTPEDEFYGTYVSELRMLFQKYAVDGKLDVANETVFYWGKLNL